MVNEMEYTEINMMASSNLCLTANTIRKVIIANCIGKALGKADKPIKFIMFGNIASVTVVTYRWDLALLVFILVCNHRTNGSNVISEMAMAIKTELKVDVKLSEALSPNRIKAPVIIVDCTALLAKTTIAYFFRSLILFRNGGVRL